jgi:hypothetical protein
VHRDVVIEFDLPVQLVRELKLRAVVQWRTVKDLVTDILSQALGLTLPSQSEKPSTSDMVHIGGDGLPVVYCDPVAAGQLGVKALLELEQEIQLKEDLSRAGLPDRP